MLLGAVFPTAVCKTVVRETSGVADEGFDSFTAHSCLGKGSGPLASRLLTPFRDTTRPVRLAAKDTGLSSWEEGFDSPTGY